MATRIDNQLVFAMYSPGLYPQFTFPNPCNVEICNTQIPADVWKNMRGKLISDEFESLINHMEVIDNDAAINFIWSTLKDKELLAELLVPRQPSRLISCYPDELGNKVLTDILSFTPSDSNDWFLNFVVQLIISAYTFKQKNMGLNPVYAPLCLAFHDLYYRNNALYNDIRNKTLVAFNIDIYKEFPLTFYCRA
ncbi:hypothetical protein TK45_00675 [Bowmanella sp. JS7-9]|nr:hypothetical protein TK45_00675 [Bowmanella sp. JS7-9]